MNDDPIRDAVHRMVASAPPPVPFEQLDRSTPPPHSRRWWVAAAAGVIAVAGVAGIAWVTQRSDDQVSPATVPPVPTVTTTETAPATTAAPETTAPVDTTVPTPVITPPDAPADGLFPVAGEVQSFTAIAPSGSIDAAPGDMVTLSVDGDLYLHPGAFDPAQYGRSPAAPIRLVDMSDPRDVVLEGEGPNVVSSVGGFVNGALIYADCCEPVSGNIYSLAEPGGPRSNFAVGWSAAPDASGRRWATVNDYALQLLDFGTGRGYSRTLETGSEHFHVGEVLWSADGAELWVLGWSHSGGVQLVRYTADSSLSEIERHVLTEPDGNVPTTSFSFAGRRADGTAVLTEIRQEGATVVSSLAFVGPDGNRAIVDPLWNLPGDATGLTVSPDGTTLAYTVDNTAYLLREGQDPVEWGTDISRVWFVTTPAMPIGIANCDPGTDPYQAPWQYADLDGDGVSERVVVAVRDVNGTPSYTVTTCGTGLEVTGPTVGSRDVPMTVTPVDVEGDGRTELWFGDGPGGSGMNVACMHLYWWADGTFGQLPAETHGCIGASSGTGGDPDTGFGCVAVDGRVVPVFYERDGLTLTANLANGTVLGTHTYASEDELVGLFDLAC